MTEKWIPPWSTISIAMATLMVLIVLVPFDESLTYWLANNNLSSFSAVWDRSLFEGDALGMSDLPILLYGAALITFFALRPIRLRTIRWAKIHAVATFISYAGLAISLGFVHPLKKLWGRARPHEVEEAKEGMERFTSWYELGHFDWLTDRFSGSLPSGHTATFLVLIGALYCALPLARKSSRQWLLICGLALVFMGSIAMGISRSMMMKHWVSDWIISIGMGWFLVHYLFFDVWRMDQRLKMNFNDGTPSEVIGAVVRRPSATKLLSIPLAIIVLVLIFRMFSWILAMI